MLRMLVLLLILANAGFFAWRQGWMGALPSGTESPREPGRRQAQVNPERLVIVPPVPASSASATAPPAALQAPASASLSSQDGSGAAACLEAGPFTAAEQRQVSATLGQRLPAGAWTTQNVAVQGLWLVYMGPYPDADSLERKQAELRRIRNLSFEEVRSPANLAMGISLGRYGQESLANAALDNLRARGIRTARVVTIRPAMALAVIRVPQADAGQQRALAGLSLPSGKGFAACGA